MLARERVAATAERAAIRMPSVYAGAHTQTHQAQDELPLHKTCVWAGEAFFINFRGRWLL